jgi:hypothetical protein
MLPFVNKGSREGNHKKEGGMIKQVLLSSGALAATLALTSSVALASSISTTGKGSVNVIANANISLCSSTNNNNLGVSTPTVQQAGTGNAKVVHNTTGGDATSGPASNQNTSMLTLKVTNKNTCNTQLLGAPTTTGDQSIDTTGSHSFNLVGSLNFSATNSVNNNSLWVSTPTIQGAQSGNALVAGNTMSSGNAKSGASGNINGTVLELTVTNN